MKGYDYILFLLCAKWDNNTKSRKGGLHAMVYTKNYHNLTIFNTYPIFMHCGENLENKFHWNFVINDSLCLNPTLGCEINVYMNDIIVQQNIILTCRALKHLCNSNKKTKKTAFNNNYSMKFYT
jgi:hypothetical protein